MSEVEKMYENAGIKPTKNWQSCLNCKLKTETRYDDWGEEYLTCKRLERPEECFDAKEYYPIFTTEKQLKIVKMILFSTWWMNLKRLQFSEKFGEGLAQMINELWQFLTEEEKQQVKGILE